MTIPVSDSPVTLFAEWLKAAEATEVNDANAVCLATADADVTSRARFSARRTIFFDGAGAPAGATSPSNLGV